MSFIKSIWSNLFLRNRLHLLVMLLFLIKITSFYQQNKSATSKIKFEQAITSGKRIFGSAKFAYANKTEEFLTSQKFGCCNL